jgi:uncharacterized protein
MRTATPRTSIKDSFAYEYRFAAEQDTKLGKGSKCLIAEDGKKTEIDSFDAEAGLLCIKLGAKRDEPPQLISLIPDECVPSKVLEQSIARTVETWESTGKLTPALDTFLRRQPPRVRGVPSGADLLGGADATDRTVTAVIANLDHSTISVQGPPGAGKTRVASAAIAELAARGYRIGISSNGHKAIQKLIEEVQKRASESGTALRVTKINRAADDELIVAEKVRGAKGIKEICFEDDDAPQIVGGTAWAFSDPAAAGKFDYLFIDEAGQVSLANLVAMSPSAHNLVLLGDQMQLGQPTRGSHPGESGQSALDYLLQGHRTVPEHLGIFLATTWRLHPDICSFISGAVYEGKLHAEPSTSRRVVRVPRRGARVIRAEAGDRVCTGRA